MKLSSPNWPTSTGIISPERFSGGWVDRVAQSDGGGRGSALSIPGSRGSKNPWPSLFIPGSWPKWAALTGRLRQVIGGGANRTIGRGWKNPLPAFAGKTLRKAEGPGLGKEEGGTGVKWPAPQTLPAYRPILLDRPRFAGDWESFDEPQPDQPSGTRYLQGSPIIVGLLEGTEPPARPSKKKKSLYRRLYHRSLSSS